MKKIAFLTAENLGDHILDEDLLENAMRSYEDVEFEYIPWDKKTDWASYDHVVIRTTWDYTSRAKKFLEVLESIENSGAKLYNPYSLVKWNHDKIYLRDLASKGVSIVDSLYFDEENFNEKVKGLGAERFVVKPRIGASSIGISFASPQELISSKSKYEKGLKYFAQPFLHEIHQGERSYFYFNNQFSYAIKKTPKEGDFRVQEEYGGVITIHKPKEEELSEAGRAVASVAEHNPLYLRVDAVVTDNGEWKLMELECIEPSMFFRVVPESASRFAKEIMRRIQA